MFLNCYKMVICDIDGTLVNSDKKVTEINRSAIRKFKAKGGLFSIATGRIEKSVLPFCEELEIDIPVILYNGARIYNPADKRIIYDRKLNSQEVSKAMALLKFYDFDPIFYSHGEAYVFSYSDRIKQYQEGDGFRCCLLDQDEKVREKELTKILMIGDSKDFKRFEAEFKNDPDCTGTLVQSEHNYLEILPQGVNKGSALEALAQYLGITPRDIMSVGDNLNDLEMIIKSGWGVAMGNAHETLKNSADFITLNNNDSGVGHAIYKFILGEPDEI